MLQLWPIFSYLNYSGRIFGGISGNGRYVEYDVDGWDETNNICRLLWATNRTNERPEQWNQQKQCSQCQRKPTIEKKLLQWRPCKIWSNKTFDTGSPFGMKRQKHTLSFEGDSENANTGRTNCSEQQKSILLCLSKFLFRHLVPILKKETTMQAITTKYIPATFDKGSKIRATMHDGDKVHASTTIGYHSSDGCPHEAACKALLQKLGLKGKWVGQHIKADTIAWVNIRASRQVTN